MNKKLSIVIPCYDEVLGIEPLLRELVPISETIKMETEIILIDDGSKDGTWLEILKYSEIHKSIVGIKLSRNFGHQSAILAGLSKASGDAIVIMDSDLQDPPALIPQLLQKFEEGYDVVHAKRRKREGESMFKLATAWVYYRLASAMSEMPWELDSGEFRLISKRVANNIIGMGEQGRIMRAMVSWVGYPQCFVAYDRPARLIGETKYPLTKMINLAYIGLISFSSIPLRLISFLGFLAAGLSSLVGIYAFLRWGLVGDTVKGWTTLIILNTGMGGLILIALGILGEYISRIYIEIKKRPHFIIEGEAKSE